MIRARNNVCIRGIRTQEEPGVLAGWGLLRRDMMTGRASAERPVVVP